MFKDCKSGGYNLEASYACVQRLISLVLLITIAYSCAVLQGKRLKQLEVHKLNYFNRVKPMKLIQVTL